MAYITKPTVFELGESNDFLDHTIAVALSGGEEVIDARTFGAPRATTTGGGMDSVTVTFAWSDVLAAALDALKGTDQDMVLEVDGGQWTASVHIPDAPPTPTFTIGEKVEVDLLLGVNDALVYTPAPGE